MVIAEMFYTVKEIMNKKFIKVKAGESIKEALNKMIDANKDEVLVVDSAGMLIGVFTRKDIAKIKKNKNISFQEEVIKYTNKNVVTIDMNASARVARNLMIENGIGRLPVIENKIIKGVITSNNIRDTFYLKIDEMFDLQNNIIDNLHEAVCICSDSGIVNYWNKSSEQLYGVRAENILGQYIGSFFPNALIMKTLKDGKRRDNEGNEPVKGKFVVLSTVPIFNNIGKLVAVVSTDRDVTEVVTLSKQLEKEKRKVELLQIAYKKEIAANYTFSSIVGKNKKIIEAIAMSQKVAQSSASILITGESGTGKEVFARSIHEASGRVGNFVAVNCSAIPEHLIESEVFGYVEGAFTGAIRKGKIGKFEFASNGTLFLDEIGDMPMEMQVKLLRVLQDGIVYRVGSEKGVVTDTRIIAATNRNLNDLMKEKKFREDLYYRFAVVQIELPPLRQRKEDIKELVDLFINQVANKENIDINSIDERIYPLLVNCKWEGNIRELKNVIQRMIVLSTEGKITLDTLPEYILENSEDKEKLALYTNESEILEQEQNKYNLAKIVESVEKNTIAEVLLSVGGNKQKAAKILNLKRSTLYYKLNQYGLLEKQN
ncbi:sigma-54-dependent Fis family transcriptional regulator [Clostridium sp. FP1]|uniref:sigma-54-dependent Fis family transcriptional regulator n=1 Tax=Clostridium sp. FP1 TaxID=2724076 RepID=UPI001CC9D909|nr:sigma-54-dependent Fis family transcriptional regulator [Clostridium sp. FP1]MBZ9633114.1 sigma 54-interacting transcriptional regulator [Clostridium sp. FP1]